MAQHKLQMDSYPLRTIGADGVSFTYREAGISGSGKLTILLLHGIGSGSGSWLPQFDRLAGLGRLLAWDAPGYGGSSPLKAADPVAADYAAALANFCDALSLSSVFLIGHSLGAMMAARFARENARRLLGLILASPAAGYGNSDAAARDGVIDQRIAMMERLGPAGMAASRAAKLLAPGSDRADIDLVARNMALLTRAGYGQAVRLLAHGDTAGDMAHIAGPVTVLCGAEDTITPPARVRKVAAAAPHGSYREIPGAGHACYIDRADAFAALVRSVVIQRSRGKP